MKSANKKSGPQKAKYRLLTVEEVRRRYWNPVTKKGRPIHFSSIQTFGEGPDPKIELGLDEVYVPNGTLIQERTQSATKSGRHLRQTILLDWLSGPAVGPYTSRKSSETFYYYGGDYVQGNQGAAGAVLQICSDPLNALSTDCLDEVNCWVLND